MAGSSEKGKPTSATTEEPLRSVVDLKKRIQVVECYAIEYQDKRFSSNWHPGQLTYYKTDQKVVLFGAKNVKLIECYNIVLEPPKIEGDKEIAKEDTNSESCKDADGKAQEKQVNSYPKDLNSLLNKVPTLNEGNEFTFEDRFLVRIDHNKFVHHKPYRVAGEDLERAAIRKRIKSMIDNQEDIFEKSGVLSVRKVQSPQQQPQIPVVQARLPKVHSHLATVPAEQAAEASNL